MKELAGVTPDQWGGFVLVLAGILATIVLISSAIKAVREMAKPQEDLKKEVKRHAECLDRDNKRIAEQEEMTRLTLRGGQRPFESRNHGKRYRKSEKSARRYHGTFD